MTLIVSIDSKHSYGCDLHTIQGQQQNTSVLGIYFTTDIIILLLRIFMANACRVVAQAVSSQLPTAAARVPSQVTWDSWRTWQVSANTLVSSNKSHTTERSIIINHPSIDNI
jgi:biopolymer transport protein ExbD